MNNFLMLLEASTSASGKGSFQMIILMVLLFVGMYFLMIRPQKKRMQEEQNFLTKLSHGDEVFTKSGILGKVVGITEKIVTLEIENGSKMKILKSHIGGSAAQLFTAEKK